MGVRPTLGDMPIEEAALMLQGLYLRDVYQISNGTPGILGSLAPGSAGIGRRRLRYRRADPNERWQSVREVWATMGGDCEDLASAVAAELTVNGIPARPVVYRVRPGLVHVVTQIEGTGELFDPSKVGGMGETKSGGLWFDPQAARVQIGQLLASQRGPGGWV